MNKDRLREWGIHSLEKNRLGSLHDSSFRNTKNHSNSPLLQWTGHETMGLNCSKDLVYVGKILLACKRSRTMAQAAFESCGISFKEKLAGHLAGVVQEQQILSPSMRED